MSKKKYYAVWGSNGLGVYNNWDKVQNSLLYMEKGANKGFHTYGEALKCAVSGYCERSGINEDFAGPIPINFIVRAEDIDQIKELGLAPHDKLILYFKDGNRIFEKA